MMTIILHTFTRSLATKAVIDFRGNILVGDLGSRTALKLVREWIDLHQTELAEDWELARAGKQIKRIAPLE